MAGKRRDTETLKRVAILYAKHSGSVTAAAVEMNVPRGTFENMVKAARDAGLLVRSGHAKPPPVASPTTTITLPKFPDEDLPATQILDHMARAFAQREAAAKARKWFTINVNESLPIAINWFGDPHLGSNGCNIPLLRRDTDIVTRTPGMYAANIGDTVDNWSGKLIRLYAENDVSRKTERTLARWFLQDTKIKWLVWLLGNHDTMDGEFSTYLSAINAQKIPLLDWRAQFILKFKNGADFRIDAAHNHKGHSMWNELHGQERASVMEEDADLFIAGHHHTWAYKIKEAVDGRVIALARVRGYKFLDSHASRWQFPTQQQGASGVTIFDPCTDSPTERVRVYMDVQAGANKLTYLRELYSKRKAA